MVLIVGMLYILGWWMFSAGVAGGIVSILAYDYWAGPNPDQVGNSKIVFNFISCGGCLIGATKAIELILLTN